MYEYNIDRQWASEHLIKLYGFSYRSPPTLAKCFHNTLSPDDDSSQCERQREHEDIMRKDSVRVCIATEIIIKSISAYVQQRRRPIRW